MITLEELKFYLQDDTIPDSILEKQLERSTEHVATITNNFEMDEDGNKQIHLPSALDEVVLYFVIQNLNSDTRRRAGKQSENDGAVSVSYEKELPHYIVDLLRANNRGRVI